MTVSLARSSASHGPGPRADEAIYIDDEGHVVARRTFADHRVGRFGRTLDAAELTKLKRALKQAADAPVDGSPRTWVPDGGTERVSVDGLAPLELDPHDGAPKGWKPLVEQLRTLLETIVADPVAAIELVIEADPIRVTLRHVGSEPLALRLDAVAVEAYVIAADDTTAGSAVTSVAGPNGADVGAPGWSWDVPVTLALPQLAPGQSLEVTVVVDIDTEGDGRWRQTRLARTLSR